MELHLKGMGLEMSEKLLNKIGEHQIEGGELQKKAEVYQKNIIKLAEEINSSEDPNELFEIFAALFHVSLSQRNQSTEKL